MAAASHPSQHEHTLPIPKKADASLIWLQTTGKRDLLAEIKGEYLKPDMESLDDAATPAELQDLHLVDGLMLLAKAMDEASDEVTLELGEIQEEELDKGSFEHVKAKYIKQIGEALALLPPDRYYRNLRDVMEVPDTDATEDTSLSSELHHAVQRTRLQLALQTIQNLDFDELMTPCARRMDRQAVEKEEGGDPFKRTTVGSDQVRGCVEASLRGSCMDRIEAVWKLYGDERVEEEEVSIVVKFVLKAVQQTLKTTVEEALDATTEHGAGWMARRRRRIWKKKLLAPLTKSLQFHFRDEVELDHRLRCMFAWSSKEHQENQMKSVLVEESSSFGGRKRYVEMPPQIKLAEFRDIQKEHLEQIDSIAKELVKGYRDFLWIDQGRGRQRNQLRRDSALFVVAISIIDYIIVGL